MEKNIFIDPAVDTREKLIRHFREGRWLNGTWDRDMPFYVEQDKRSVTARLGRCEDGSKDFSITFVVQIEREPEDWDDLVWLPYLNGPMASIEQLLTQDVFDGIRMGLVAGLRYNEKTEHIELT